MGVFDYLLCAEVGGVVTGNARVSKLESFRCFVYSSILTRYQALSIPELDDLEIGPWGGTWSASCVDKLLSGRSWRLVLLFTQVEGRQQGMCSPDLSGFWKDLSQFPRAG